MYLLILVLLGPHAQWGIESNVIKFKTKQSCEVAKSHIRLNKNIKGYSTIICVKDR